MMSGCCKHEAAAACSLPERELGICPSCEKKARSVSTLTVKSLVRDHTRVSAGGSYWFCRTPECDVVYFSKKAVFRKPDVKVRVGLKEKQDPIPLCYCFDYTREDIRSDITHRGQSDIPDKIKAEVQGGFCACEIKNPSGACCLGDIGSAIQEMRKQSEHVSSTTE
jgi:hypothetical protein